jgi:hypothetical protein
MAANTTTTVQLYQTGLTKRERGDFARAERTIAQGLKSFIEVGMALKEIRDKRLYREHYRTFEAYVAERWDLSRPRAYELCAASTVVADLSGIPDIRLLPENEAQANPLTWLKAPKHRRQAWKMALRMANASGQPVTARHVEAAVMKINGKDQILPVSGLPVYHAADRIRAAFADPPYLGGARQRYNCPEVDHRQLIERLETFDAWALSLSSTTLQQVLPLCPEGVRIGAWVKPWCAFRPNVNPAFCWEPVIFKLARRRTRQQPTIRDWISVNATSNRGVVGAKPDAFCFWIFEMLNLRPGDEFCDLYEGSGAVTRAFRTWLAQLGSGAGASTKK